MRTLLKTQSGAKRFKRRFVRAAKALPHTKFGDSAYYFDNNFRLDLVHVRLFRRVVRRCCRKQRSANKVRHTWLCLKPGFPLSKKSKNSRMGKGHGMFFRWAFKVYPYRVFMAFWGFNYHTLKNAANRMGYYIPVKPRLVSHQPQVVNLGGHSIERLCNKNQK